MLQREAEQSNNRAIKEQDQNTHLTCRAYLRPQEAIFLQECGVFLFTPAAGWCGPGFRTDNLQSTRLAKLNGL